MQQPGNTNGKGKGKEVRPGNGNSQREEIGPAQRSVENVFDIFADLPADLPTTKADAAAIDETSSKTSKEDQTT